MRKFVKNIIVHPLITGSFTIFISTFIANVGGFLFNLYMASNLTIADYGILASMMSIVTLSAYAANAIVPSMIQFGGKYFAENNFPAIKELYFKAGKFQLSLGIVALLGFIIFAGQINKFFHLSSTTLLIITSLSVFVSIMMTLNLSLLQSKLAFTYMSLITIIASIGKLFIGIVLVKLGMSIIGAVLAILISAIIPMLLSFFPIRFVFQTSRNNITLKTKEIFFYGIPSALCILALNSLITVDIMLVKHFFTADTAGLYAGLSLIGRVIFFFTAPIGMVMFPLVVQKFNKQENYLSTFLLAQVIVTLSSVGISLIYYIFPEQIILLFLKQKEYLTLIPLLGSFSIFITLFSILSILVNFYISIRVTKIVYLILAAAILQIIFIRAYHTTLMEIIMVSTIMVFLLLICLMLYFPYASKIR